MHTPASLGTGIAPVRNIRTRCVPRRMAHIGPEAGCGRGGPGWSAAAYVTGPYEFAVLEGVTHRVPEEAPGRPPEIIERRLTPS